MSEQKMTLEQIRRAGLDALARDLGPVGMVRFIQQFETGWGDYRSSDINGSVEKMSGN